MSKCTKVKHPCKICLGNVTQRNGLQCQGACQSWVHYACLNYTPGKIKDIKSGTIRVTCPCPDCKTIMPKEYRTKAPYTCTNQQCPANRPPSCQNQRCPINDSGAKQAAKPPCPLGKCGNSCKQHSTPQIPEANQRPKCIPPPCVPPPGTPPLIPSPTQSDSCFNTNKCVSGCTSNQSLASPCPGDQANSQAASMCAIEDMCNTIGLLTNQLNDLMCKMQNIAGSCPPPSCPPPPCPPPPCPPPPCPPRENCCCRKNN